MNYENKTVAIVGAGIVGCSCALWMQKKGFKVVLIDPEEPGSGTSSGNACTIADYGCIPVNNPALIKRLPSLLFSANSPLSLKPGYVLTHLPWMISFLRNCSPPKVAHITRALGELLAKTYAGLDPLLEMADARDLLKQQGCLHVYEKEAEFQAAAITNQIRREHGASFEAVNSGEIAELEPHLKPIFTGGYLFDKASQVLNPKTLVNRYFECLMRNQGEYIPAKAVEVKQDNDSINLLLDNGGNLLVDRVVIAAGAFSRDIKGSGAQLLPLDTERGYHVQYRDLQHLLNRPVSWNEAGFYATPMNEGLRLAGTVEIAGYGKSKNPRNLNYLHRKGAEMLDLPVAADSDWLGFRPSFPDALPVIGYSPMSEQILLAFGHQHLGLTLAGITGKLIAELANEESSGHNLTPFSPGRFL
ncbi:MAG: glycine/D-amino acid oxidase-like deaminating enzyme [Planctomycetota bacterium]|jgi:glycine/D-amino acid oxidase-like deaminating enzyme